MDYKTIKRELRRMGVAHSDAAAFIRVYKKIRQKGKGRMVRDIMGPVLPAGVANLELGHSRKVERLFGEHWASVEELRQADYENLEGHIRLEIAKRLAGGLMGSDAVVWTKKVETKAGRPYYVLRGALDVVLPEEKSPRPAGSELYAEGVFDKVTQMEPWGQNGKAGDQ